MQLKRMKLKIIQLLLASDNYISSYEIANSTLAFLEDSEDRNEDC